MKEIVVSGTRPTGRLHLGNYLGAVKQFVRLQEDYTCYFFIADFHSLTTHPNPKLLHENVRTVLIEYLACGLDPNKITIYRQSDIPQTAELYLFLNMHAYLGELERVPTFKEKARTQPDNINAGLLTYPTLMAADILIHKGEKVPVGKDQEQHLEMTRNFAKRFNNIYGVDYFPETLPFKIGEELIKVPGLDGKGKMGKSEGEGNAVYLFESPKDIDKKVMRAVTDTGPTEEYQPMSEGVKNLFTIMSFVSSEEVQMHFLEVYNNMSIRYGDMKKQISQDLINYLTPIREKINTISGDDTFLREVLKTGKEKAYENAQNTIQEVREIMGIKKI